MREARSVVTDDCDTSDNKLQIQQGGNGDWYVSILPKDHVATRTVVRLSTSGGAGSRFPGLTRILLELWKVLDPEGRRKALDAFEVESRRERVDIFRVVCRWQQFATERRDARVIDRDLSEWVNYGFTWTEIDELGAAIDKTDSGEQALVKLKAAIIRMLGLPK